MTTKRIDPKKDKDMIDMLEGTPPNLDYVAYNKIAVDSNNFHIEIITAEDRMQVVQERVVELLALCSDENYRDMYFKAKRKLLEDEINKMEEKEHEI